VDAWSLLKEIRESWPAVRSARWAVYSGVVFGAILGFGASTLWWSGTVGALRERVEYWKDRTRDAPSISPRHLTAEQQAKLVSALKPLAATISNVAVMSEPLPETLRYASEFIKVLKDAGINPIGPMIGWAEADNDRGVMVGLTDISKPSEKALSFIYALRSAGLDVKTVKWSVPNQTADFDLFLGPP
jgi:hypothetical protein